MRASALNTKFGKVDNKVPGHAKYITSPEFDKFAGSMFGTKLI